MFCKSCHTEKLLCLGCFFFCFFKVNLKCPGHSQPQIPHTLPEGHVRKTESPVCTGSEGAVH